MFFNGPDEFDCKHPKRTDKYKLRGAGEKMKSRQYAEEFSSKIRTWASVIGDSRVLSMVSVRDVRASEYFYHKNCLAEFDRKYEVAIKETALSQADAKDELCKLFAFHSVKEYLKSSMLDVFPLQDLEDVYLKSLKKSGINRKSNITKFAEYFI